MSEYKPNNYKGLADLCQFLNEKQPIKNKKYFSIKEILHVFENAKLVYFDDNTNRYELTDFMKNSGGCFVTKGGKILFNENFYKLMTEDTEDYSSNDWLNWFCDLYKANKPITNKLKPLPYNLYLVKSKDKILMVYAHSSRAVKYRFDKQNKSYDSIKKVVLKNK